MKGRKPGLVRRLLALGFVAAVIGAAVPAAAGAATYVAMGDSYSSGTGTREYYEGCERSIHAYPYLIKDSLGGSFAFTACGGAQTQDVLNNQLGPLDAGTEYATISIGGNDAGFSDVITQCALPITSCDGDIDQAQAFIQNTLPARLDSVYSAIRSRAPNADVAVVGYPRLFNGTDCNAATFFSSGEMTRLNQTADILASVTRARALAHGFKFVDSIPAFIGHAVCDNPEWLNGLSNPVGESYHPNRLGHSQGFAPIVKATLLGNALPTILNQGVGCNSEGVNQTAWLVSCTTTGEVGNNESARRTRVSALVSHDADKSIDEFLTDEWGNGTATRGVNCQRPNIAGGYPRSRCDFTFTQNTSGAGIAGGTGINCIGGTRWTNDRVLGVRARDTANQTMIPPTNSRIKFTSAGHAGGCTDPAYVYQWNGIGTNSGTFGNCSSPTGNNFGSNNGSSNQIEPGDELTFCYTGDSPGSGESFDGIRWRLRNLRTGDKGPTTSSCPNNGDNQRKGVRVTFPNRGAWVVEAELLVNSSNTSCGGASANRAGYWFPIGTADVNSPASDLSFALNTTRPQLNGTATITAGNFSDGDAANGGGIQIVEWDLDDDGDYEQSTIANAGQVFGSPQSKTIDTGGQEPGLHTVRARVYDNGAMDAADSIRRTKVETATYLVDSPPTAEAQSVVAESGKATPVTLHGSDPDNDPLSFTIVDQPDHGTLTGSGAGRTYTSDGAYAGEDSFTFQVSDGFGGTDTETVTIHVAPDTAIDSGPGATDDPTPTWTFSASPAADGVSFECSIDQGSPNWEPCAGPGASHTPASDLDDGDYTFRVRAALGQGIDPTPATRDFTVSTADMELVSNRASQTPAFAGETLTYTIQARNNGPGTAENARVVDTLPTGVEFQSSSIPCAASGDELTCGLGDLANGEQTTFTVTVSIPRDLVYDNGGPLTLTNAATVDSDRYDRDSSNDEQDASTLVQAKGDLGIVDSSVTNPAELIVGEPMTVTLHDLITNNGPSAPMDAGVVVNASASGSGAVDPATSQRVESALGYEEQRGLDQEFQISCTRGGSATFTFTSEISPDRPDDVDPEPDNDAATVSFEVECIVPVAINIHPGSFDNPINLGSNGVIPVAVLTTSAGEYGLPRGFDAAEIDPRTVRFGPHELIADGRGAPESHNRLHIEDAIERDETTQDGDLDAILHFATKKAQLTGNETAVCVRGRFGPDDLIFEGCDSVTFVP